MSSKALFYVCLLIMVGLMPGCSQKHAIIGVWQRGQAQSFFQFEADGAFRSLGEDASKVSGRYSFSGRGILRLDLAGSPVPKTLKVAINGDDMTLTEASGTVKLHRVDLSKVQPAAPSEDKVSRELNRWLAPAPNDGKPKQ